MNARMNNAICAFCASDLPDNLGVCPSCGMSQAAPTQALPQGTRLQGGIYVTERMIDEGGFSITYKGAHSLLKRTVAIKELFPEGAVRAGTRVLVPNERLDEFRDERENMLQEARLIAELESPNVVSVHEVFLENGTVYIVMEYLEGQTLQERIDSLGQLPLPEVQEIASDICEALTTMHQNNVLHRDIKPANVVLTKDSRAVLIDFGSAREFVIRQTVQHTRILTEDYAAPEQYSRRARFGPYTDIYSLGATLFHALTGTPPPRSLERILGAESVVNFPQEIQGSMCSAIQQALQLRVQDRPQDVEAFKELLSHVPPASTPPLRPNSTLASPNSQQETSAAPANPQSKSLPPRNTYTSGKNMGTGGLVLRRGLILTTLAITLFVAVPVLSANYLFPFRFLEDKFWSLLFLQNQASLVLPTPIPKANVVDRSITPVLTPTPVIQSPTSSPGPTRASSALQVIINRAHTNTSSNLRVGPGVVYGLVGSLAENTNVRPVSRSRDGNWLKLDTGAWIYAELVDDVPSGLHVETDYPIPPPPTATQVPTSTPVPVLGDWLLPVPMNVPFLMQDGLEIRIQDVIYGNDKRMQSYIERRAGENCDGCLAVKFEIVNRSGNEREYLVQEDIKLLQVGPHADPYTQVKCQHPSGLRSMTNPSNLRGLAKNIGGEERVACFKGVIELSQDVRLGYSPTYIYDDHITPTPTPQGEIHYAYDAKEKDQEYRTGWSVFFKLLGS